MRKGGLGAHCHEGGGDTDTALRNHTVTLIFQYQNLFMSIKVLFQTFSSCFEIIFSSLSNKIAERL